MFGPIYLFWHIDWYWIVGYYNLFFTYSALTLYKSYNRDSNYRRKYHPIIYLGLPLILNFVGFLISLLNGFEEIRKDEKVKEKSLNKNISQRIKRQTRMSEMNMNFYLLIVSIMRILNYKNSLSIVKILILRNIRLMPFMAKF